MPAFFVQLIYIHEVSVSNKGSKICHECSNPSSVYAVYCPVCKTPFAKLGEVPSQTEDYTHAYYTNGCISSFFDDSISSIENKIESFIELFD